MLNSLLFNWVSSYIIASIPNLREIFSGKKDIESRINASYKKALKRWTPNEYIRDIVPEEYASVDALREFLSVQKNDRLGLFHGLLNLWVDELRKDELCYNFILETKLDKINDDTAIIKQSQEEINSKLDNVLTYDQFSTAIAQITNSGNTARLVEFVRTLISETISLLVERLRVKTALDIIESVEELCKDLLNSDIGLRSDLLYLKGKALRYLDNERAGECFHKAYILSPTDDDKRIAEIKRVILKDGFEEARSMVEYLPQSNLFRIAFEVSQSNDPEGEFTTHPEIKTDASIKQEIALLLTVSKGRSITFLFSDNDCVCPDTLTYSNIDEWMYVISFRRLPIGSFLKINREDIDNNYKLAFDAAEKFVNLLNETDLRDAFPVINMLHCYWGYLINGEQSWLAKYQSIDKEKLGEQKYIYQLYEVCLLMMLGRTEDAFSSMSRMSDSDDRAVVDLCILIGHDYEKDDFMSFGLKQARDKGIKISTFDSLILASYLNPDNAVSLGGYIDEQSFDNPIEKDLLIQLCNLAKGDEIDVSSFRDKTDSLSDELTAYAAMLMAKSGEDELAVSILTPRVDEKTLDIRTRIFIDILSSKSHHYPHLYRLLRDNRKRGVHHVFLLKKEVELASKLADYSGAFEVMEILYAMCPESQEIMCNYAIMWIRSGRPLNDEIKHLIEDLEYEDINDIVRIYRSLVETDRVEYAAEFLYNRTMASENDELKHLFFSESTNGYIVKVVSQELDEITAGVCVLIKFRDRPKTFIVKDSTTLGKALIGKKKGDRVLVLDEEYEVISIHPHYFKLHADYLDEVMFGGGNDKMTPFKIDENNIWESFENAIKQFSPDSLNYEEKKQKLNDDYQAGNIPYSHLIEEPDVIGWYYKGLFTNFRYRVPFAYSSMHVVDDLSEDSKFVIELPALLLLFEFSNHSGFIPNIKPVLPNFVYEYIKSKRTYLEYHVSFPFHEAINWGKLKRFNDTVSEDVRLRMQALVEWIEEHCIIITNEEALAINDGRDNESEVLMLCKHTISFLMCKNPHYVLISDEPYYSKQRVPVPTMSTEVFVRLYNPDQYDSLLKFMFECNIMGPLLTKDIIVDEYNRLQAGQANRILEIIECIAGNPMQLMVVLDASVYLAANKEKHEFLESYITGLFQSCLRIMPQQFYLSQEWQGLIDLLSLPVKGYEVVKRCVLAARQKVLS